ncbi:MAG TPA: NUDIX hydrolase [bacterium]|nr:NUDIX hydrolase [bacterium]
MTLRLVGSRRVFDGQVIGVRLDEIELPSGRRMVAEIVEHRGAVAIVPVTASGDVLLVRQFRHAVGRELLEVPAGTIEPGEPADVCARRELAEEVGCAAAQWDRLLSFYPSPGVMTEELYVYLARELSPRPTDREEEDLRVEPHPLADARRLVSSGEVCDAKSIIGLQAACDRLGIPR